MKTKILDLGCGEINNKYGIYNQGNDTIGIDIDADNIRNAQEKFPFQRFILTDGKTLPFSDNEFDVVHSLDVLEHVDDLEGVVTEVVRVLKKGGIMKIEVPYWKSEERLLCINPRYWDALHHVRMFRDGEMEELMSRHGLERIDYKRIKFFDNILLGYYLKRGDIINQRGVVGGITPLQHFYVNLSTEFLTLYIKYHRNIGITNFQKVSTLNLKKYKSDHLVFSMIFM